MNRCGASASACDGRQKLWRQALLQAGPPVRRLGVCPVPVRSQLVTLQAQSGRQHLTRKALPAVRVIPGVAQDHVPLIVVRMEVEELCMPCTAHGSSLNWEPARAVRGASSLIHKSGMITGVTSRVACLFINFIAGLPPRCPLTNPQRPLQRTLLLLHFVSYSPPSFHP